MSASELTQRCRDRRDEFWRGVGQLGAPVDASGSLDEPARWPSGASSYVRVTAVHTGIIATDGLSDPETSATASDPGLPPGRGLEIYIEGTELADDGDAEARWLVTALEEAAGALAAAGTSTLDALAEHRLLSLELSGEGAPAQWCGPGSGPQVLGALVGVELPGREAAVDVDGASVRMLALSPLRPSELAIVRSEGSQGRDRVAQALAAQGWYSYADTQRPAVC